MPLFDTELDFCSFYVWLIRSAVMELKDVLIETTIAAFHKKVEEKSIFYLKYPHSVHYGLAGIYFAQCKASGA